MDPLIVLGVAAVVVVGLWLAVRSRSPETTEGWSSPPPPRSQTHKQIPRGKLKSPAPASPQARQRRPTNFPAVGWTPVPAGWSSPLSSTNIHSTSFIPGRGTLPKLSLSPVPQLNTPEPQRAGIMGGKSSVPERIINSPYMGSAQSPQRSVYGRRPLRSQENQSLHTVQRSLSPPGHPAGSPCPHQASPVVAGRGNIGGKDVAAKPSSPEWAKPETAMDLQESVLGGVRKRKLEQQQDTESKRKRSPPKESPGTSRESPSQHIPPQRRPVPMEIPRVAEKRPLELSDDEDDVRGDEKKGRVDDSGPPTPELPTPEIKSNLPLRKGRLIAKGSVEYMAKVPKSNFSYEEYMADRLAEEERVSDMLKAVSSMDKGKEKDTKESTAASTSGTTSTSPDVTTPANSSSLTTDTIPTAAVKPMTNITSGKAEPAAPQAANMPSPAAVKLDLNKEPSASTSGNAQNSAGLIALAGGISGSQPSSSTPAVVPSNGESKGPPLVPTSSNPSVNPPSISTPVSINISSSSTASAPGTTTSSEFKPLFNFAQSSAAGTDVKTSLTTSTAQGTQPQSDTKSVPDAEPPTMRAPPPYSAPSQSGLGIFGQNAASAPAPSFGSNVGTALSSTSAAGQVGISGTSTTNSSQSSAVFGNLVSSTGSNPASQSGFAFGTGSTSTTTAASAFEGTPSGGSGFGTNALSQPSGFGTNNTTSSSGFGATSSAQPFGLAPANTTQQSGLNLSTAKSGFGTNTATQPSGFSFNPTSQTPSFGSSTGNQPSGFGTAGGSQPSGFGSSTSANQPTAFGSSTSSQLSGFGTSATPQPAGFGSNTPSQSSGFGASMNGQQAGFGTSTTSSSGFTAGKLPTPNFSFGKTESTTSGTTQQPSFGSSAPKTQGFNFSSSTGVSNAGNSANNPIPSFGNSSSSNPNSNTGFNFADMSSTKTPVKSLDFSSTTTPQKTNFQFGQSNPPSKPGGAGQTAQNGFSFGTPKTSAPNLNFGSTTTQSGITFGTPAKASTISFGQNVASTPAKSGFASNTAPAFGSSQAGNSGATFGSAFGTNSAGQSQPNSGFGFGTPTAPGTPATGSPMFSMGSGNTAPKPRGAPRAARRRVNKR